MMNDAEVKKKKELFFVSTVCFVFVYAPVPVPVPFGFLFRRSLISPFFRVLIFFPFFMDTIINDDNEKKKKYKTSSKKNAMKVLDGSVEKFQSMESKFAECFTFPTLSSATSEFVTDNTNNVNVTNEKVSKAVSTTLDAIASVAQDVRTVESFLHLHIPKMEDGNNFGVTVQLSLLKQLSDLQEVITAKIDDLSGYASARADALEKLKLPSTSKSVTKSTSTSTTDGKEEKKTSESTEEKETAGGTDGGVAEQLSLQSRKVALAAVDTLYYSKAERAFQSVLINYMAALDFMDKNKEKLEKPKGSEDTRGGYSSMY